MPTTENNMPTAENNTHDTAGDIGPLPALPKVSQEKWWPEWRPYANDTQKASVYGLRAWDMCVRATLQGCVRPCYHYLETPMSKEPTARELKDRREIFKWLYASTSQELNVMWMLDWVSWNPENPDPHHLYLKVFHAFEFDGPEEVTAAYVDDKRRSSDSESDDGLLPCLNPI